MTSVSKNIKKSIPKSIHEMSKEKLQETLKKKKECNAKAQEIVIAMCEFQIDENWFLDNLHLINQSHFEDVTVERAIIKLCGYPLCDNKIEKVTQQQYHISTRYNKVFDLTERKNFCSSSCYKAAMYVKNQLYTSPLWFRDQEIKPKYKVLKESKSSLGNEVDKTALELDSKDTKFETHIGLKDKSKVKPNKPSVSSLDEIETLPNTIAAKAKCIDMENQADQYPLSAGTVLVTANSMNTKVDSQFSSKPNTSDPNFQGLEGNFQKLNLSEKYKQEKQTQHKGINDNQMCKKDSEDIKLFNMSGIADEIKCEISKNEYKQFSGSVQNVESAVFEWFSLDTLFFVFGEKKIRDMFKDLSSQMKEVLNSKLCSAHYDEKIENMIKLYGLLESDTFKNDTFKPNLKPLPDYTAIQEESKMLDIKVRAFYSGNLEIKKSDIDESSKKKENQQNDAENVDIYLPLIDSKAQNMLRRKILLDKIGRVLPNLMKAFSRNYILPMGEIKRLISTFVLTAHNITFKPAEWTLVCIIMIKLLSIKDKYLSEILKSKSSEEQLELLLTTCNLEPNYLDSLIKKLVDGKNIIQRIT